MSNIQLLNEDCMTVMARYPDKYFDLAVVDPPYGIGINVNMGRRKGDKNSKYHRFHGNDNSIPDHQYFLELKRVSQNQIVWGGNYMTDHLPPTSCWILWDKGFSPNVTFAQFEMAWTSFTSTCKKFNFNAAANLNRIHPTQKPVALYSWILKNYGGGHMKILDTHLGSGSSAIAANEFGVSEFVGCEIDKDYYEAAVKRFELVTSQQSLFSA